MIGKLRHRLILQAPQFTDDGLGGKDRQWQRVAQLWADVRDLSGGEKEFADGQRATTQTRILIRWRSDITTQMRFLYGARILNITALLDKSGTKRFLTCLCQEDE